MGNTFTNELDNSLEYIHSPKLHHCPIKPFPISKPIPIVQNKQNNSEIRSQSLPGSFEANIINNKQGNEYSTTMGRHISSNKINRYNFTPTYFENIEKYD